MSREGAQICAHNKAVIIYGASIYPYWDHGGVLYRAKGWLREDFKHYIDMRMLDAVAAGLNTLRLTNYLDDSYFWNYEIVWENIDYLIREAQTHNLWVSLDLSTFRNWLQKKGIRDVYNIDYWRPFLEFVGNRYMDSPRLAYYAILGEIPASANSGLTSAEYIDFYRQATEILHAADDGHHLISVGGLSFLNYDSGIPWRDIYSLPLNSMAAVHIYSEGDRNISLPSVSEWAKEQNLPLLVEEFGFQQALGDEQRAQDYQRMFDLFNSYAASGILFWNLGPEVAAVSHDVGPDTPVLWQVIQQNAP